MLPAAKQDRKKDGICRPFFVPRERDQEVVCGGSVTVNGLLWPP